MANYGKAQALRAWEGDVSSLILEMKRLSGVRTDTELAEFLGVNQSTVSTWKRRKFVPDQVLLTLEIKLLQREQNRVQQPIAVIALAMRAAEYLYERQRTRGSLAGRWLAYSSTAALLKNAMDAIGANLTRIEESTGRWAVDIAAELIEDEHFLSELANWIETRSKKSEVEHPGWLEPPGDD